MSSATLPAVQSNGSGHYPIDRDAVLKAIGINPRDANAQALLLTCERYGLDPILKHAMLIQGRLYVTRDGLLHVAHRSGQFDGIEVIEQGETSTHHTAKVSVYRKDMGRPFTYIGRYPKTGGNKGYGPEMAVKCAEVMALRRAFNVAMCAREEAWEQDLEPAPAINADAGRREVNATFPAQPKPPQAPTRSTAAPKPAMPDWDKFIRDRMDQARKAWTTEMVVAGVPKAQQEHPDFQLPHVSRLINHFVSIAVESGSIEASSVAKDGKPNVRDPEKAKAAMAALYREWPDNVREAIDEYLDAAKAPMKVKLAMDDLDPEDESQDGPGLDPENQGHPLDEALSS